MPWLCPGDIVLWGHSSLTRRPLILAYVRCGQTAGWIKMPLGTEVGLSQGDFVLDGDPAPPKGAQQPPLFGPCLLWPNGRPSQLQLSCCWFRHTHRPTGPVLANWGLYAATSAFNTNSLPRRCCCNPRYPVCNSRPHLRSNATRPKMLRTDFHEILGTDRLRTREVLITF